VESMWIPPGIVTAIEWDRDDRGMGPWRRSNGIVTTVEWDRDGDRMGS
jgi:hypothetical protein